MRGMPRPKKYAAGTANVNDDDFNRGFSSISTNELVGLQPTGMLDSFTTLSPVPEYTPSRIDDPTYQESAFGPGVYELGQAGQSLSNPDSAAAREQASYEASKKEDDLRSRMELQDSLRREFAPIKPGKRYSLGYSLKTGTEKVPGKGSGKVDTVDAKLAPGEAVLNKAAAEHLGRGFIKMLNHMGMMKMGMVEPDEEGHYACGTEEVMKKGKK